MHLGVGDWLYKVKYLCLIACLAALPQGLAHISTQ